jgi:hypothetical protein
MDKYINKTKKKEKRKTKKKKRRERERARRRRGKENFKQPALFSFLKQIKFFPLEQRLFYAS